MEKGTTLSFDTIEDLNNYVKSDTKNHLVSVIDWSSYHAALAEEDVKIYQGFYSVCLKFPKDFEKLSQEVKEGAGTPTVVVIPPEKTISRKARREEMEFNLYILAFSPTLIKGSTFGRHISEYTFMQYDIKESLYPTEDELDVMKSIFRRVDEELHHEEDRNTLHILTDQIKLILDHCLRFYDRQFTTRHSQNYQIAQEFLQNINLYLNSGMAKKMGVPSISYFADLSHTSPGYFSDIIKKETGVNIKKYLQYKIIEAAKQMLSATDKPINEIAEWLGFKYPQHFTRLFKHEAGMSPRDFRKQIKREQQ